MIKNILILGLTFFKLSASAQDFSLTYGFPEVTPATGQSDPSNAPTLNGLTFELFRALGTSANPNASARFSFTGWPVGALSGDDNYGNYSAVLSPTIYYEVTLSVMPGYTLSLSTLNFDVRRSGTGVRTYCVRSSLDNFTTNLATNTGTSTQLEIIPNDIFFWKYDSISTTNDQKGSRINFNSTFRSLSDSITFRFYAWNAEASGGSFSIDNVNFKGAVLDSTLLTSLRKDLTIVEPSSKIKVYPNPCNKETLSIKCSSNYSSVKLINVWGQLCRSEKYEQAKEILELNTSELANGFYILSCESCNI